MANSSPPPSPTALFNAQLLVEKAKRAKQKGKKSNTKPTAKATSKSTKKQQENSDAAGDDSDKENVGRKEDDVDGISWAKNHADTDRLLTVIEESSRYKQALGFKVADDALVTSGGLTTIQICRNIGQVLFPKTSIPVDKLGLSIKNRVQQIKRTYNQYHKKLGETGHGLVMEDRTQEIVPGTPIHNVFDKMKGKFPWYKRLHLLLCASPVYDTSALANSVTPLNTAVLVKTLPNQGTGGRASPDWDMATLDASFDDDREQDARSSPAPSPPTTDTQPSVSDSQSQPAFPATPVPAKSTTASDAPKSVPAKRKNQMDHVKELTEVYGASRLAAEQVKAEGKRQRVLIQAENQLAIERLKAEEQERQRQHEQQLIDKKILLARLQAGIPDHI